MIVMSMHRSPARARPPATPPQYGARVPYLVPRAGSPAPSETALIVPVPAADTVVGEHRRRLDAAAAWGVPAHVTVVYPFLEPHQADDEVVAALARQVAAVPAFDCRFARTRWFGQEVLWLQPEPAQPFRHLVEVVTAAFPDHPPYGGAYDEVVPHLTVGDVRVGGLAAVRAAERAVRTALPVTARIDRVLLIAGSAAPDSWGVLHEWRLRDGP
jgi:2'-5' RNA ligase